MAEVSTPNRWLRGTYFAQGIYYLATGIWPLMHIDSFQWVTGEKTDHLPTGLPGDHWLVMTVGVLVTAIGLSLLTATLRRVHLVELTILGIVSAAGLTVVDIVYVFRGVILPIYLVDAALQIGLIAAWGFALSRQLRQG